MRMKRSRLQTFFLKNRVVVKDNEGCSTETWSDGARFFGEQWPASGKVQAQQYGDRLGYILNMKVNGDYEIKSDSHGNLYDFGDDLVFRENDGICVFTSAESEPDYRIISIKPYRFLTMELEKI